MPLKFWLNKSQINKTNTYFL